LCDGEAAADAITAGLAGAGQAPLLAYQNGVFARFRDFCGCASISTGSNVAGRRHLSGDTGCGGDRTIFSAQKCPGIVATENQASAVAQIRSQRRRIARLPEELIA
jgi:hypothetical protein